jgi:hypothetical protein
MHSSSDLYLKQSKRVTEPNIWSAVLALDAKYNHYRFNNSQLRNLYIKRRSQLLRENSNKDDSLSSRQFYLNIRSQILKQKYGSSNDQMFVLFCFHFNFILIFYFIEVYIVLVEGVKVVQKHK